jgi:ABC-type uncharacterized transport system involved in gliding motility auxiliary subunit
VSRSRSVYTLRWAVGVLLLVVFALASMLLARNDFVHDFTQGKRRSLAPQTRRILESIQQPVQLVAFYEGLPEERAAFMDLVDRFQEVSPRLHLRMVDLNREPQVAEEYGITLNRTVIVEYGDLRVRTVDPGEAKLIGAILRATSGKAPRVYFVAGHGEASIEDDSRAGISSAARLLAEQNFNLRILHTEVTDRIPSDADVVVLASPEKRFTESEMVQFTEYLMRGGHLAAMLEPAGSPSADSLVARFGILAEPGYVVDASEEARNLLGDGNYRFAVALGGRPGHPITDGFTLPVVFPLARGIGLEQPPPDGVDASRLLQTGVPSWMEQDLRTMGEGKPVFQDGVDVPGPVGLAFAATISLRRFILDPSLRSTFSSLASQMGPDFDVRDTTVTDTLVAGGMAVPRAPREFSRLVVIGDVDFINNANLRAQGNSAFFLATMHWLAEQENRIALAAKDQASQPLVLTQRQRLAVRWIALVALPLCMLMIAVWVAWRRRSWV